MQKDQWKSSLGAKNLFVNPTGLDGFGLNFYHFMWAQACALVCVHKWSGVAFLIGKRKTDVKIDAENVRHRISLCFACSGNESKV